MDKLNDVTNSYKKDSSFYLLSLFFQEHIHEIPYITMDEVASRTFISKSQISKYVRYLDYQTYIDFKDACLEYLESLERRRYNFKTQHTLEENILDFTDTMVRSEERRVGKECRSMSYPYQCKKKEVKRI